jgi:phospholipase/lecithinase/hemolysin
MKDQARLRNMAVACLTILVLGIPGLSNADGKSDFGRLIIFGDSLSDAGNFYLATGKSVTAPFLPIPDAPYKFRGKFRFTDGPTWIEQLARKLHTKRSGKPALKKPGKYTNYAFGRARARTDADPYPMFDLEEQRTQFMTDFGWSAPADATYVIWIGGNDVRDGLEALATGETEQIFAEALTAIYTHIYQLWALGARNFLVLNVPDLSITPAIGGLPPMPPGLPLPPGLTIQQIAQGLSVQFNSNLAATLDGLEGALPGVKITRLDVFTLLNSVVAAPRDFGFKNVTEPCLTFLVVEDYLCKKQKHYLFLDAVHPTTRGHRVLARAAEDLLEDDTDDDDHHHGKGRHHHDHDDD